MPIKRQEEGKIGAGGTRTMGSNCISEKKMFTKQLKRKCVKAE